MPVIPNWEQTQQLGRCVYEDASHVLPRTVQAACISHPFKEGRSPNKCSSMSPPKLVPCLLFLHLLLHLPCLYKFSPTSNPIIPLLWLSMQNYLGLGSGHSCPCSVYKRKRMEQLGWEARTWNLCLLFQLLLPALARTLPKPHLGKEVASSWRRDAISVPGSVRNSCGCVTVEDAHGGAHWGPFNGSSHWEGLPCAQSFKAHKDLDTMLEKNTLGIGCAVDSAWSEPYISTRFKKRL